jgi:hypothetical protein
MTFTPTFKVASKINVAFSTYNPASEDRKSLPVQIVELAFNERTRSIEVTGSDNRKRQARVDRFANEADLKSLTKRLQSAYDKGTNVSFIAAGGFSPDVWFYNIVDSI